jgi:hypothetical protein
VKRAAEFLGRDLSLYFSVKRDHPHLVIGLAEKAMSSQLSRIRALLEKLRQLFRKDPDPPVDPYAYVGAPKKPRPSNRSAAAVMELPEE